MRRISAIMLTMAAISSGPAVAAGTADLASLACGAHAITLGMSPADIKAACGQQWKPSYISKHTRPAVGKDDGSKDHFEKWMYKLTGKKVTHVIFKNGEVVRIFTHK
jgi:hypothetical protein